MLQHQGFDYSGWNKGRGGASNVIDTDFFARTICSGYATDAVESIYASSGFRGWISKPFFMRLLTETVAEVIPRV